MTGLGITHILVNPRFHATMTPLLNSLPERYRRRYDDGRWAIYEVVIDRARSSSHAQRSSGYIDPAPLPPPLPRTEKPSKQP